MRQAGDLAWGRAWLSRGAAAQPPSPALKVPRDAKSDAGPERGAAGGSMGQPPRRAPYISHPFHAALRARSGALGVGREARAGAAPKTSRRHGEGAPHPPSCPNHYRSQPVRPAALPGQAAPRTTAPQYQADSKSLGGSFCKGFCPQGCYGTEMVSSETSPPRTLTVCRTPNWAREISTCAKRKGGFSLDSRGNRSPG